MTRLFQLSTCRTSPQRSQHCQEGARIGPKTRPEPEEAETEVIEETEAEEAEEVKLHPEEDQDILPHPQRVAVIVITFMVIKPGTAWLH